MIQNTNRLVMPHDVSRIEIAIEQRSIKFKRELEDYVNDWIKDVNSDNLDYVGSRVGGPDPKPVSIQDQIERIISSIESWGEE